MIRARTWQRLALAVFVPAFAACAGRAPEPALPSRLAVAPPKPAQPKDAAIAEETRKQAELVVRQNIDDGARVNALFWPLTRAASPLCGEHAYASIGPWPSSVAHTAPVFRSAWKTLLGVDDRLTFLFVVANTPAARAGIRPGDVLLAVDDEVVSTSSDGLKVFADHLRMAAARMARVVLSLERGGAPLRVAVEVEKTCAVAVAVRSDNAVNASAVGQAVFVNRGFLRVVDDRELAVTLGHELGHIAAGHTRSKPLPPTTAGGTRGRPQRPPSDAERRVEGALAQQRELEADRLGLYLTAAAGFPVKDAANVVRKLAVAHSGRGIEGDPRSTHPAAPERFVALDRVAQEVEANPTTPLVPKDGAAPLPRIEPPGPWEVVWSRPSTPPPPAP